MACVPRALPGRYHDLLSPNLRSLATLAAAAALLAVAAIQFKSRVPVVTTASLLLGAWLAGRVILPRAAHRAFQRGEFRRAGFTYALLAHVRIDLAARAAARVSHAACQVGREDYRRALAGLERQREASMPEAVRAAWLNNRAYAMCRSDGEPAAALSLAEAAVALRPDVPGFRHTRGIVLLAAGRVDDAIRELDEVWRRQDERRPWPLLEAERCFDLGRAWTRKGDASYAADYFERARQSAPASPWARRASEELSPGLRGDPALDELL